MLSEIARQRGNQRAEISSLTLVDRWSVHVYMIGAKDFGAMVFNYICQVVQHAMSSVAHAMEKVWQVCQKWL